MTGTGDSSEPKRGLSGRSGFVAFQHTDYTFYFISRVSSVFGVDLMSATLFWQLWRITQEELVYAALGVGMFLPFLILFPLSGWTADHHPRTKILLGTVSLQGLCAASFLYLTWTDAPFLWFIPSIALLGVARAFQQPAQQAIVPVLVPPGHLANAIAWQSTAFQSARVLGWGISGTIIAIGEASGVNEQFAYIVVVAVLVFSAFFTFLIKARAQIMAKDPLNFSTVAAGLRFVFSRKIILGAIGLDLVAVLLGSAKAMMPIYATKVLQIETALYGLLQGSLVMGSLVFMLGLTQLPIRRHAGRKLFFAVGAFGLFTIVFGLSTVFWVSLVALFFVGAGDSISIFIRNNLVQIITPDEMRGRVNAVNSVFIGASNELGDAESGAVAHVFGPVAAVVIGGVGTIIVTIAFARKIPDLWNVDRLDPDDLVRKYRDVEPAAKPAAQAGV